MSLSQRATQIAAVMAAIDALTLDQKDAIVSRREKADWRSRVQVMAPLLPTEPTSRVKALRYISAVENAWTRRLHDLGCKDASDYITGWAAICETVTAISPADYRLLIDPLALVVPELRSG